MSLFLKVYKDVDDQAHDTSQEEAFPAYIDGVDTSLAPFCPTSTARVLKTLRMGKVGPGDRVIDLGCGDGRFLTAAVGEFDCDSGLGIESDEDLVILSRKLADRYYGDEYNCHTKHNLTFNHGDLLKTLKDGCQQALTIKDKENNRKDEAYLPWTVVILFLLPDHTHRFAEDILTLYQRGAKIISLVFNLSEIEGLTLQEEDSQDGIYVYSVNPL
ncbi:hypothetical protein BJ944DRAFT_268715 [Cunninghamella echinulata]|nr:hypothetical protein BJ944DRAFT_268715 [Cunninghamella echinulata]